MLSSPRRWSPGRSGGEINKKQDMHSFAIEAGEVNTPIGECHGGSQLIDGGVLGVRDGDTVADSGRSELFALEDRRDDHIAVLGGDPPGRREALDHASDCLGLGVRFEIGEDRVGNDKFSQPHETLRGIPSRFHRPALAR